MAEWIEMSSIASKAAPISSPLAMAEWIEIEHPPRKADYKLVSASDGGVD